MKKNILIVLLIVLALYGRSFAQTGQRITLEEPRKTGGMPLMEALDNRQSIRSFSRDELSSQDLSNLLWSAFGINREDGRRTAPSARNWQPFDIYLIMADGWYVYEPTDHSLIRLGEEDLREYAGGQDFVRTAPVNLFYVSDYERISAVRPEMRELHSATDVGFIAQNVYLFCASEGLATVVRGAIDRDMLHEVLNLRPEQRVILGQTVGYPDSR